jgi:small subunit ribosomal protein S17
VSTVQPARNLRKTRTGVVVSDAMEKTVVVRVDRSLQHPAYKKVIRLSTRFKAHDEENKCKIGDKVVIMETRPISKTKRWRVLEILTPKK